MELSSATLELDPVLGDSWFAMDGVKMNREERIMAWHADEDGTVRGYMWLTDYMSELGSTLGGNVGVSVSAATAKRISAAKTKRESLKLRFG